MVASPVACLATVDALDRAGANVVAVDAATAAGTAVAAAVEVVEVGWVLKLVEILPIKIPIKCNTKA